MEESQLIDRIKEMALRPPSSVVCSSKRFPAASRSAVEDAERQLGLPLPALLKRLYLEVGNGGFGPGYGLFGVEGGHTADVFDLPLPDLYLQECPDSWPDKLVNICDWGCMMTSAVDCSTPEGQMVFVGDSGPLFMPEGIPFAQWLEDWANGVDLFARAYGRYQRADRPTLPPPFDY